MSYSFKLQINKYLKQCDSKDVISFSSDIWISTQKLIDIVKQSFGNSGIKSVQEYISSNVSNLGNSSIWFGQGADCEILRAGSKGWQKGKLKINVTLEFIPDEPEETSPLDDVRQEIDRDNS